MNIRTRPSVNASAEADADWKQHDTCWSHPTGEGEAQRQSRADSSFDHEGIVHQGCTSAGQIINGD